MEEVEEEDIPSEESEVVRVDNGRLPYALASRRPAGIEPLRFLCVRAIAKFAGPDPLPIVQEDLVLERVHYDSLDVDMPLEKCYHIKSERFWQRVTVLKHFDKMIALRQNVDWKGLGISLKFVELLEAASVEYWSIEEPDLLALAKKIHGFVGEMHIRHLQSLQDFSFHKYYMPQELSSEDEELEELGPQSSVPTSEDEEDPLDMIPDDLKTESQLELQRKRAEEKATRKLARQMLRQSKLDARLEWEAKWQRREAKRLKREEAEQGEVPKKKKKKKRNPKSIFDIELSEPEEEDRDANILDNRNKEKYLDFKKNYTFPSDHCHHINLKLVQFFTNLHTFTIEFRGPGHLGRFYHPRHLKFSLDDIKNLAAGLSKLPHLRIFRLRNSRMNSDKLITIIRSFMYMTTLEVVDFGYDHLSDDCANYLYELFEYTTTLRSLELEGNELGLESLTALGDALKRYKAGCLTYLGLARNPITDDALYAFVSAILPTEHVVSLNLRGIKCVTDKGLVSSIAKELMRQHSVLRELDLTAVPLGKEAVKHLIKALDENRQILKFGYLGCGMNAEDERDVGILVRRNKYIFDNPYVDDQSKTNEEIDEFVNRTKNPILLEVLAEREEIIECPTHSFYDYIPSPPSSSAETGRETDESLVTGEGEEELPPPPPKLKLFLSKEYVDPDANNLYLINFKEKFRVYNQLKNITLV